MIIRSQDKKFLTTDINLEVMTPEHSSVEGRTIRGYSFEELLNGEKHEIEPIAESRIYNSQGRLLATYSTEEKAIKVLDMIEDAYNKCFAFAMGNDGYYHEVRESKVFQDTLLPIFHHQSFLP